MIPVLITFLAVGLLFLINYILFKMRNNPISNRFEYENLRPYRTDPGSIYYEENESDVQKLKI